MPDEAVPWRDLLAEAERRLGEAGVDSAGIEARRIVEEASGYEGAEYVLGLGRPATERGVRHFDAMLERRSGGEPLQYVLGRWAFRTLDLFVDQRVLIPRPETEVVAGLALAEIDRLGAALAVDLGTGSGAIALSLVAERPGVEVWAVDVDPAALDVARANLAGLGRPAQRIRLAEGSWFAALPSQLRGRVDVIVANPPYVAERDVLPAEVRAWEPRRALVPGPTGLEAIEVIVGEAPGWLARPGALIVELAPHQADAVLAMAGSAGFTEAEVHPDLSGRPRALVAAT